MLTQLTEDRLQSATDEEIKEVFTEDNEGISPEALDFLTKFTRLPQKVRGEIIYSLNYSIFCKQCGATSCIHGYPED